MSAGSASDGGGAGTNVSPSNAPPGTANTGGGGGAEGYNSGNSGTGGTGGSGFIVLRMPSSFSATFTPGVSQTLSTSVPGWNIYSVTATSTGSETVKFKKG
jgi:hypothetical protein